MKDFILPTLYKKNSNGSLQYWKIRTEMSNQGFKLYPTIVTEYGQLGTDSPQETFEYIKEGKNIGKKNKTTAEEQANKEAEAKWLTQKKKGYVESIEDAKSDIVDKIIEGGISPMLAHSFDKHGHKIIYPAHISPKLDGLRCIAMLNSGKCTLWSRSKKKITSMPHLIEILEKNISEDTILDGEIYADSHKNNFEEIVSLVRQESPHENHHKMEYHIFDIVKDGPYKTRLNDINNLVNKINSNFIKSVPSFSINNEEEAIAYFNKFVSDGFEGAMIRNSDSKYVHKRSHDLLKIKEFLDNEFPIVGIEEGRGKLAGHVGAFVCKSINGLTFSVKMSGETSKLKEYFQNHDLWKNKKLTIQYQGLTSVDKVPRFPIGKAIRNYE